MEWTGENWTIIHGRWEDSPPATMTVDHVITDPPFDATSHKNGRRGAWNGPNMAISESAPKSFDPLTTNDVHRIANDLVRISRRWVVTFCAFEQLGDYQRAVGDDAYIRSGCWNKTDPTPQFTGDRPGVFGEALAIMHSRARNDDGTLVERCRWNRGGHCARWTYRAGSNFSKRDKRIHETQKPLSLMIDLVESFTDPDDLIWDPYCGSGTTGVAAIVSGRKFIGHEMQERYARAAAKRLEAESKGLTVKDVEAGQTGILELLSD